jgi:hypothetical protein
LVGHLNDCRHYASGWRMDCVSLDARQKFTAVGRRRLAGRWRKKKAPPQRG